MAVVGGNGLRVVYATCELFVFPGIGIVGLSEGECPLVMSHCEFVVQKGNMTMLIHFKT